MSASVITSSSLVTSLPMCLVTNWHTYLQTRLDAGSTVLNSVLPPLLLQELLSVIGTNYAYLTICDGIRGEDILVHKEGNNIVCAAVQNSYPQGSEIRACNSPIAMYKLLYTALNGQGNSVSSTVSM